MVRKVAFGAIILLGFLVRLYKIDSPIADWHSWRQADTSAVSRNFVKYGFDLLRPRFDDISSIPSGRENPQGWRFVEFPIYNFFQAGLFKVFDKFSLEVWGRLTSVFSSLISLVFLFLIADYFLGQQVALLTAFFFACLPFNIFYSRSVLPGPMAVMFFLISNYCFIRMFESKKSDLIWLFISAACGAVAMLISPYTAFFLLFPLGFLCINVFFSTPDQRKKVIFYGLTFALVVLLPFFLWRFWMKQFPEGIPANLWLFNEGGIRFRPAWFRWLFNERLGKLILGGWGLVFLVLGLLDRKKARADLFFYSWLAGVIAFLSVIAKGNIQHDYYQILILPAICIYLARGILLFLGLRVDSVRKIALPFLVSGVLAFSLAFSWYEVSGYYQINRPEIVEAGRMADKLLPKNAKVIAPYGGDTAFLYQINRPGWPEFTDSVTKLQELGATHIVAVNFDARIAEAEKEYPVLLRTDKYIIISLISLEPR